MPEEVRGVCEYVEHVSGGDGCPVFLVIGQPVAKEGRKNRVGSSQAHSVRLTQNTQVTTTYNSKVFAQ
jgi:hypothetical protein